MVHSTGANNPNLRRYVQPDDGKLGVNTSGNDWNRLHPGGRKVCVHAFIGKLADGSIATYQTLPWNMRGWHAGGSANSNGYIGFEICEDGLTDPVYFAKVYREAVELTAYLCKLYSLDPLADPLLTCLEICAGAGGQALGLSLAGFSHVALVEYEQPYCDVLRANRPDWPVICADVHDFDGRPYAGKIDLFAGGVPCPPFSVAGQQLGKDDERDLFPQALRLISEIHPKAVMLENVRGLLDARFDDYRAAIISGLESLGYRVDMRLLQASSYGVPQLRPRVIIVGLRNDIPTQFVWPTETPIAAPTVGETIGDLMAANGWKQAAEWAANANGIAPTLVGGSKKHGGPDLGPVRARKAWAALGVDGKGVANEAPFPDFDGMPRLTPRMMARIQGFPDAWSFGNRKTLACRMIGNAFPPPVARAVGEKIKEALEQ